MAGKKQVRQTEEFTREIAELLPNYIVKPIGESSAKAEMPGGGQVIITKAGHGYYSVIIDLALIADKGELLPLIVTIASHS